MGSLWLAVPLQNPGLLFTCHFLISLEQLAPRWLICFCSSCLLGSADGSLRIHEYAGWNRSDSSWARCFCAGRSWYSAGFAILHQCSFLNSESKLQGLAVSPACKSQSDAYIFSCAAHSVSRYHSTDPPLCLSSVGRPPSSSTNTGLLFQANSQILSCSTYFRRGLSECSPTKSSPAASKWRMLRWRGLLGFPRHSLCSLVSSSSLSSTCLW